MIPNELKYTKEHEWIRIEGTTAVVGISDYAQSHLGDITFIELPKVGREIKQLETFSTVESVKAASDIYAPISGKVIEVNEVLRDKPEIVNSSPYVDGWICKVSAANPSELKNLMDSTSYKKYVEGLK